MSKSLYSKPVILGHEHGVMFTWIEIIDGNRYYFNSKEAGAEFREKYNFNKQYNNKLEDIINE